MKTLLQILTIFSVIAAQAQYTLTDHEGNPITNGEIVTAYYDVMVADPEAQFDVEVLSENSNNFRFQIVNTNQGDNAENWLCTNFGLCYPPVVTDVEVELLADQTRELQLHYKPNGHTEDATVVYRITEVGNTSNTVLFSVKYVGTSVSIKESFSPDNKIKAHPNPANKSANIVYDLSEDSKIYLYNILGEKLETHILNKGSGALVIDTSKLKSGIYLYQLISKSNESITKYLVVNR